MPFVKKAPEVFARLASTFSDELDWTSLLYLVQAYFRKRGSWVGIEALTIRSRAAGYNVICMGLEFKAKVLGWCTSFSWFERAYLVTRVWIGCCTCTSAFSFVGRRFHFAVGLWRCVFEDIRRD
jgi:hypothetical protein